MDKRQALRSIFWVLDNGAKWKDLPRKFGAESSVHKYFTLWTRWGVFESHMRDAGELVEERAGYRLYECSIDATFSTARRGGDGEGVTKARKGVSVLMLVDARRLPVAVATGSATPHESTAVLGLFNFMLSEGTPDRIIGDKAYDSDALAEDMDDEDIELIAPHRRGRKKQTTAQDGRPLRRSKQR